MSTGYDGRELALPEPPLFVSGAGTEIYRPKSSENRPADTSWAAGRGSVREDAAWRGVMLASFSREKAAAVVQGCGIADLKIQGSEETDPYRVPFQYVIPPASDDSETSTASTELPEKAARRHGPPPRWRGAARCYNCCNARFCGPNS